MSSLWEIAGRPPVAGDAPGYCRICGLPKHGLLFSDWVRDTFTDHDKLQPGEIICHACQFLFDESSELLRAKTGKDRPQRMRNYSHFVVDDKWFALSKGEKAQMKELLRGTPFPSLAVVAESGQKHLLFRARWNPPGSRLGYVQFEEQSAIIDPGRLDWLLERMEMLLSVFSKAEIESGQYAQHRILKFGLSRWEACENSLKAVRDSVVFKLALFLAQKGEDDDGATTEDCGLAAAGLARSVAGLQTQVHEHLGTVREQHPQRGLHQQSGQVRQLALFEDGRGDRQERG